MQEGPKHVETSFTLRLLAAFSGEASQLGAVGTALHKVPLGHVCHKLGSNNGELSWKQSEPDPGLGCGPSLGDSLLTWRAELSLAAHRLPRSCPCSSGGLSLTIRWQGPVLAPSLLAKGKPRLQDTSTNPEVQPKATALVPRDGTARWKGTCLN